MAPCVVLWDMIKLCCKSIYDCNAFIRDLEVNSDSLNRGKRELESIYNYIRGRVEGAKEAHGYVPKDSVLGWLKRAEESISKVDSLLHRGEKEKEKQCLGCYCSKNYWSGENISKEVVEETQTVRDLIGRGNFEVVADPPPQPVVENLPTETTVGLESRLRDVWSYIEDDSVKIIGMYGVRGVGKTTLLEQLRKKFQDTTHNFGVVIYVKASTELNIAEIQRVVGNRLEIPDDTWKEKNDQGRAAEIYRRLIEKKFVLLLDDVREPIEVSEAGVPVQNGSKIVFTTILEEVCSTMDAERRFKVDYLPPEDAWNLFRLKVTDDVLNSHPEIPLLARTVADMCGGLPLALTTIGSSRDLNSSDPDIWQHAIDALKSFPSEFQGMGTRIFPRLKFSYDSLSTKTQKTCFLYCSLFPRNESIEKDKLIQLWIGEGLLRDSRGIAVARRHGKYIIENLKHSCLLEEDEGSENFIRMHDMLREMALWIALQENNKILVLDEEDGLITEKGISNWNDAVRVSLWQCPLTIDSLIPMQPSFPRLLTLLVRLTWIKEFSNNFFQSMHALRVLDSSFNMYLKKFPVGRGELTNLRYLNLSYTNISELPMEMKGFTQLRILLLDGMWYLIHIPVGLISSLSSLQVFSWVPNQHTLNTLYYTIGDQRTVIPVVTVALLEELESLDDMQEISIVLSTRESIDGFKSSSKLQSSIRRLGILSPDYDTLDMLSSRMQNDGYFLNLRDLSIINCPVKELTFLIHIPSLQYLSVVACHSLEEIIAYDDVVGLSEIEEKNMFFNLKEAVFSSLPNLKSICRKATAFPSLEGVVVSGCPSLRKLPFNSESGKNISIVGEEEWWNQLEWDDDATKLVFSSKFKNIRLKIE